uniref:Uncharacterized protein n=1 Tax=Romanomermis culicivorax TaxID=13658 RepID=A0A915K146_ROMCU
VLLLDKFYLHAILRKALGHGAQLKPVESPLVENQAGQLPHPQGTPDCLWITPVNLAVSSVVCPQTKLNQNPGWEPAEMDLEDEELMQNHFEQRFMYNIHK